MWKKGSWQGKFTNEITIAILMITLSNWKCYNSAEWELVYCLKQRALQPTDNCIVSLHLFTSMILNLEEMCWIPAALLVLLFKMMIKRKQPNNLNPPTNTKRALEQPTPHSMQVLTYQQLSTWQDSWASHSWRVLAEGCFETLSHAGPHQPVWQVEFTSQFSGGKWSHLLHPPPCSSFP